MSSLLLTLKPKIFNYTVNNPEIVSMVSKLYSSQNLKIEVSI